MGDLAALHAQARRLTLSLRGGLDRLEASEGVGGASHSVALAREMHQKLADLQRTSTEMDSIWRMQVVRENATKRDIWKRKVEQVSEEADHLKTALDKYGTRERRRQVEEEERAELLARRSTGGPAGWQRPGVDEEAALMGHVSNSKRVLEEAYQTGTAILGNMSSQRERLKAAQRKVLDVLNSVGLSDSLLRVIDRRQRLDRWITYGGMAPKYRLYAVGEPITKPTKPGMIRMPKATCISVPLEVYDIPLQNFGTFISKVPPPLAIGTVELEDGSLVKGFICEGYIADGGEGIEDITHLGSWLGYLDRPRRVLTSRHDVVA